MEEFFMIGRTALIREPETEELYALYGNTAGVCTDSRKVERNSMFFALKGESFDGNRFAADALRKGAAYAVVDDPEIWDAYCRGRKREAEASAGPSGGGDEFSSGMILVPDVLAALQQMARYHRLQFRIPVIGLTGTNGKTTTKELITAVLSARYRVTSTSGNFNNHIGVPLTLLRIGPETEVAVVEMGASAPGEIRMLAELVCPSFGLITNVGMAHLSGFGSFEGVKRAKGELYDNLSSHKKIAFVNTDRPELKEMVRQRPELHIVPYGVENDGVRILPESGEEPYLRMVVPNPCIENVDGNEPAWLEVKTRLVGRYNADNVSAALCIATYFAVPVREAIAAIEAYVPSNNRSQLERTARNTLIIDAYNANPSSMKASLDNFGKASFERRVLILGDMLELGEDSLREHGQVLRQAEALRPERIFLVGGEFGRAWESLGKPDPEHILLFPDVSALRSRLEREPLSGCSVLIKGSHGIHLESLPEVL